MTKADSNKLDQTFSLEALRQLQTRAINMFMCGYINIY